MKVAVLGDTGMLGGMLKRYLETREGIDVVGFSRKDGLKVCPTYHLPFEIAETLDGVDYIVNCIGAIKPVFSDSSRLIEAIYTNAIFPHELVEMFPDTKVIHITTDCVFDGLDGCYTEKSLHNALDDYGKSKSLGESDDCMVIRTSIIGPEWGGNKRSLVEWVISNAGRELNGFANHIWNGLTTLELSRCIGDIMVNDMYANGVVHLYSNDISKYELLQLLNNAWELGIIVSPVPAKMFCNRTLRTTKGLNSILKPKRMHEMFEELRCFIEMDRAEYV